MCTSMNSSFTAAKPLIAKPGDARKADAAAARVRRPAFAAAAASGADPVDKLSFVTPKPQPGGAVREYWIEARDALWDIVPSRPRRDLWHGRAIAGPSVFRAFVYQQMTEGFAAPKGPAAIPGPTLQCEVGDTLVVHFRNGLGAKYDQAITMHPHGVRYNPEYDGVYLGEGAWGITRAAALYFDKAPSELTVGEAALLAAIPAHPDANNPIAGPDRARARRDAIVENMVAHGWISRAQAEAARAEPLP